MMRLDLISSSVAISLFLLFYFASVSVLTLYWVVVFGRSTADANGINVWYAAVSLGGARSLRGVLGHIAGPKALHARRSDGHDHDDGVPHLPGRPSAHRLLLKRPRDRPSSWPRSGAPMHRGWPTTPSRSSRTTPPSRDGSRRVGLDPAHRGRGVLPRPPRVITTSTTLVDNQGAASTLQAIQAAVPVRTLHDRVRSPKRHPRTSSPVCRDHQPGAPDIGKAHHSCDRTHNLFRR
jgi:hypothetical protein